MHKRLLLKVKELRIKYTFVDIVRSLVKALLYQFLDYLSLILLISKRFSC